MRAKSEKSTAVAGLDGITRARNILGSNWFWVVAYGAILAVLPLVYSSNYYVKILIILGINTIIVLGLNLLMGYAGQVSIGHAAFYGMGAYASAIATTKFGLSPWIGLGLAIVLGGLVAYAIAIPTLRLKGHYLAMATLGFAEIVSVLFQEIREFTGGTDGLYGLPSLAMGGIEFDTPQKLFLIVWVFVILGVTISINVANSRVGRALKAVHGSEIAASAMGVDTAKYKIQVFVLSAVMACVGGSLYAHMAGYVSPGTFTIGVSITFVTMAVFGGMTSIWGAVIGASILTVLQEHLKEYEDFNMVIFGAILVLVMIFMPQGLIGASARIRNLFMKKAKTVTDAVGEKSAAS